MKINKLLQILVMCCFVFACTKDTFEDKTADDTNQRIAADQYDNSYYGVYKGMFTTTDGLTQGNVVVTLSPTNEGIAQITLSTGDIIELKSSKIKLGLDNIVSNLRFSSAGLSNIDATLDFSVESDGLNPTITNVTFDDKESEIFIAKNLSRAPLAPIMGTYACNNCPSFPSGSRRTWNIMSIGAGNGVGFAIQVSFSGRVYTETGTQSGCATSAGYTTCNIGGFVTNVLGYNIQWGGTHKYNAGSASNEPQCAQVSGNWSIISGSGPFAGATGTFISNTTCTGPAVANDLCSGAIAINSGDSKSGSSTNATTTGAPGTCGTSLNTGPGVWYSYTNTTASSKNMIVDTQGSVFDTKLGVFTGNCGALSCVGGNDDINFPANPQSKVSFVAGAGISYYFYVTGFQQAAGNYVINLVESVPPANDLCGAALSITLASATASGDTTTATSTGAPATCNGVTLNAAPGVWYSFSTPTTKLVKVDTVGSAFDTRLGVSSGTCTALTCVTANDNGPTGVTPQSELTFSAIGGTQYYFYVTGVNSLSAGAYTINVSEVFPPVNDVCGGATIISCGGTASGTTTTATATGAPATCTTSLNTAPGVWFKFTSPSSVQNVTVSTLGSNFDTKLGVFRGTCAGLICVGGNDDFSGVTSQVSFTSLASTDYYFYVTGFDTATGSYNLSVACVTPPPPVVFSLTPACGTTLVDNGGNSNYSNNRNDTYTMTAPAGQVVRLPFTVFNLENTWDFMRIYNSPDGVALGAEITNVNGVVTGNYGATRIGFTGTGVRSGTTNPNSLQGQTVVSSGRYLIVKFISDGSVTAAGFLATVTCGPPRLAGDGYQRTSDTFVPGLSQSVPKVIEITEAQKLQAYNKKKQQEAKREQEGFRVFTDAEKEAYIRGHKN
jgi:hypothetical protein